MKSNINSVEVHLQLSNNKHLVDGALMGVSSLQLSNIIMNMHESFVKWFSCFDEVCH